MTNDNINTAVIDAMYNDPLLGWLAGLGFSIYQWVLLFGIAFLMLDLLNDLLTSRAKGKRLAETFSSLFTQVPFALAEKFIFGGFVYLYFYIWLAIPWKIESTLWMGVVAIIAADFIYYWEHRACHRVRFLWAAHSVHHSSSVFNTATAFRFSLFDPVISAFFHLPLVLMGMNPIYLLLGELVVQAYQFWIHNEIIGKLGPLEKIFNTPSHHRVHHGSDDKYIDKNYGGILIIWDKLFGSFKAEEETPTYGITTPINTINPIKVQFFEFSGLGRDVVHARGSKQRLGYLLRPPGWQPK